MSSPTPSAPPYLGDSAAGDVPVAPSTPSYPSTRIDHVQSTGFAVPPGANTAPAATGGTVLYPDTPTHTSAGSVVAPAVQIQPAQKKSALASATSAGEIDGDGGGAPQQNGDADAAVHPPAAPEEVQEAAKPEPDAAAAETAPDAAPPVRAVEEPVENSAVPAVQSQSDAEAERSASPRPPSQSPVPQVSSAQPVVEEVEDEEDDDFAALRADMEREVEAAEAAAVAAAAAPPAVERATVTPPPLSASAADGGGAAAFSAPSPASVVAAQSGAGEQRSVRDAVDHIQSQISSILSMVASMHVVVMQSEKQSAETAARVAALERLVANSLAGIDAQLGELPTRTAEAIKEARVARAVRSMQQKQMKELGGSDGGAAVESSPKLAKKAPKPKKSEPVVQTAVQAAPRSYEPPVQQAVQAAPKPKPAVRFQELQQESPIGQPYRAPAAEAPTQQPPLQPQPPQQPQQRDPVIYSQLPANPANNDTRPLASSLRAAELAAQADTGAALYRRDSGTLYPSRVEQAPQVTAAAAPPMTPQIYRAPARPAAASPTTTRDQQLRADEELAKRLQEEMNKPAPAANPSPVQAAPAQYSAYNRPQRPSASAQPVAADGTAECPVCRLRMPSAVLPVHVNDHFDEEDDEDDYYSDDDMQQQQQQQPPQQRRWGLFNRNNAAPAKPPRPQQPTVVHRANPNNAYAQQASQYLPQQQQQQQQSGTARRLANGNVVYYPNQ